MKYFNLIILAFFFILNACSDTKKIAPKEGRIAVIDNVELQKSTEKIRIDKAVNVSEWVAPNCNSRNKMPAITLNKATKAWKERGAEGRAENDLPMQAPVIVKDRIYTIDNKSNIIARNVKDGEKIWRNDMGIKRQGVGLTADKNLVIAVDENGTINCFDTKGKMLWKKEFNTPFRSSPLLFNNNLYLLSSNNDLFVLNAKTGKENWHYKTATPLTLLQGMGRPALSNNILVVPFSTGEVIGFDALTGILLWSQDLVGQKAFDAVAGLAQMTASPVIENGLVYLVGHG